MINMTNNSDMTCAICGKKTFNCKHVDPKDVLCGLVGKMVTVVTVTAAIRRMKFITFDQNFFYFDDTDGMVITNRATVVSIGSNIKAKEVKKVGVEMHG